MKYSVLLTTYGAHLEVLKTVQRTVDESDISCGLAIGVAATEAPQIRDVRVEIRRLDDPAT
jgi:hypothetical protein